MKQKRAPNIMRAKIQPITNRPFLSLDLESDIDSPASFLEGNSFPCGTRVVKPLDYVFTVSSRSVVETHSVCTESSFNTEESADAEEGAGHAAQMKQEESTPDAIMVLSLAEHKLVSVEGRDINRKHHTHESSITSMKSFSISIEEQNSDEIEVQLSSNADITCKEIQISTDNDFILITETYNGHNSSKKEDRCTMGVEIKGEEDSLLTGRKSDTIMEVGRLRTQSEVLRDHECDVLSFVQVGCVEDDYSTVQSSSSSEYDHEEDDNRCGINSSVHPITPTSVLEYSDIDRFLSKPENEKQQIHRFPSSNLESNVLNHPSKKDAGMRYSLNTALLSMDSSDILQLPEIGQQAVQLSNSSMYMSTSATITTTLTLLGDQEKHFKNIFTKETEDDHASYVTSYASGALRPLKWVGAKSLLERRLLTDGSSVVTLNGNATISLDAYLQRVWLQKDGVTNPRIQDPRWAALLRQHTSYHRPRDWLCHNAHHHSTAEFQEETGLPILSRVMKKKV